jgi:hypothetical protein
MANDPTKAPRAPKAPKAPQGPRPLGKPRIITVPLPAKPGTRP